jgi:hypothetical protein
MNSTEDRPSMAPEVASKEVHTPRGEKDLHSLAERTLHGFTRAKPDEDRRLRPTNVRPLDILVSRESVGRAVRIMDKVLKALEAAGTKVTVSQGDRALTTVTVDGEELCIRLYEGIGRVNHIPTDEERIRIKKYPGIHGVPEWDEAPSGKLTLAVVNEEFRGVRMRWGDGSSHSLERKVCDFIDGLIEVARAKKSWREEREKERSRWEEARRMEEEAASRRYEEQQRARELTEQIDLWSLSRRIREYIADLGENALQPEIWTISKIPLPEWMDWALRYADSIDPVAPIRKARQTKTPSEKGRRPCQGEHIME